MSKRSRSTSVSRTRTLNVDRESNNETSVKDDKENRVRIRAQTAKLINPLLSQEEALYGFEPMEEHTSLWKNIVSSINDVETCMQNIEEFLNVFTPNYKEFTKDFGVELYTTTLYYHIPYLTASEGVSISRFLNVQLASIIKNVRDGKIMECDHALALLVLLDILSLPPDNHKQITTSILFGDISNLIGVCVHENKHLISEDIQKEQTEDTPNFRLQMTLAFALRILTNFITTSGSWPAHPSVINQVRNFQKDFLKVQLIRTLHNCFQVLDTIKQQAGLGRSHLCLQIICLNLLGAFIENSLAKSGLSYGLIALLVNILAWPNILKNYNAPNSLTKESHPDFEYEYQAQILVIRIIAEIIVDNETNFQKITSLDGWGKLIDVILWVTEVYSINEAIQTEFYQQSPAHSTEETTPQTPLAPEEEANIFSHSTIFGDRETEVIPLPPPNPVARIRSSHLDRIFELLNFLCGNIPAYDDNSSVPLVRTITSIVIDTFNMDVRHSPSARRVREKLQSEYPELQLYVLEFIVNLIQQNPQLLGMCHKICRLSDVLFSSHFYYCGLELGRLGLRLGEPIQEKNLTRQYLWSKLHRQVLGFLEFCGTMHTNNIRECGKLFQLIDTFYYDFTQLLPPLSSLAVILQRNLKATQSILLKFKALPIIIKAMKQQQKLYKLISQMSVQEAEQLGYPPGDLRQARFAAIVVLRCALNGNDDVKALLIKDPVATEVLLDGLFEIDIRHYCFHFILTLMASVNLPESYHINDSILVLYDQYFKLFRIAQAKDFSLLLLLFNGIRLVIARNDKTRRFFREAGAFLNITSLLHVENSPDRLPQVCVQVLATLVSLLAHSETSKEYMCQNIGYDQLKELILRSLSFDNRDYLPKELSGLMFDLLVDGHFDLETRYTIQNPDAIEFFFKIVLHLPQEYRDRMIDMFTKLVEKCPLNQSLCCERSLIFSLLDLVPAINQDDNLLQRIYSLIELLGTHSISVRELKRQFLLLKSKPGDFRPLAQLRTMKALQFMALSRTNSPAHFFDMNGKDSGLAIPSPDKWPRSAGYSFCVWMRVENLASLNQGPGHNPRLISFLDKGGFGMELYLYKEQNDRPGYFHLKISYVYSSQSRTAKLKQDAYLFKGFSFRVQRWYFISVVHTGQRKFSRKGSKIKLFVNGVKHDKAPLKYPDVPFNLTKARIGMNALSEGPGRKLKRAHYFFGQLGAILIFDDALSAANAKSVFIKATQGELNQAGTGCFGPDLENKLLVYYNGAARAGKYLLDLSPERVNNKILNAQILGRVHSCVTHDVKDIIHCLGGIRVVFPIFAQLDQPEVPVSEDQPINYAIDTRLIVNAISLLGDLLSNSPSNQDVMQKSQGFEVIGYLLEKSSPEHISGESVIALEDLAHKLKDCESLYVSLWKSILLNCSIWIFSHAQAQWDLLKLLNNSIQSSPNLFRNSITSVPALLDIMYFYYWYDSNDSRAINLQGINPPYHPVTKQLLGSRPSKESLTTLHRAIFTAITSLIRDGISEKDTEAIVRAIIQISDREYLLELLQFTLSCLLLPVPNFGTHLLNICGTSLFILLVQNHDDEPLRICALKIISSLWTIQNDKAKTRNDFLILMKVLTRFSLDTNNALWSILIGELDSEFKQTNFVSKQTIREAYALLAILKLISVADSELREKVLSDIYLLLNSRETNRSQLVNIRGWQHWFLYLIGNNKSFLQEGEHQVVTEIILNIFKVLIIQSFPNPQQVQRIIHQTLAFATYYESSNSQLDRLEFSQSLFTKVLKGLHNLVPTEGQSLSRVTYQSPGVIQSLVILIGAIEEYLFYSPVAEEIYQLQTGKPLGAETECKYSISKPVSAPSFRCDEQGHWKDLSFIQICLDTIASLRFFEPSMYSSINPISEELVKQVVIRTSVYQILLRILLQVIRVSDNSIVCAEYLPRVRVLLVQDINLVGKKRKNVSYALRYCLSSLLLSTQLAQSNLPKALAIIPLLKELIGLCMAILPPVKTEKPMKSYLLQSVSSQEFFGELMSRNWQPLMNWATQQAAAFEADERADCSLIDKVRSKWLAPVAEYYSKQKKHQISIENKLSEKFQSIYQLRTAEIERKSKFTQSKELAERGTARVWRKILRSLTNERGPWAVNDEGKLHWKLDKIENFSRMRLKMKQNYKFDPHLNAAKDPPKGQTTEDTPSSQEPTPSVSPVVNPLPRLASGMKLLSIGEQVDSGADDLLPAEDLSQPDIEQQKLVYSTTCELVTPLSSLNGKLEVTKTLISFKEESDQTPGSSANLNKQPKEIKLSVNRLQFVNLRRYHLQRSAIEFFTEDRTSYLFNFSKKDRNKLYQKIISLHPPNLIPLESSQEKLLKQLDLTRKWQLRQLSNFDYLMQLNSLAGRSFNDLAQYPVFPWVISDYTSPTIDLADPRIYRDLSKPIGALNQSRLETLVERSAAFMDPEIPNFLYGSHYSNSGIVLFYLVRTEPFTSLFLQLQGGKFDHADRMFWSIPRCWNNVLTGPADFKELIPEFFYFPEFLRNSNEFHLGYSQTGAALGDVELPSWASSPEEFIRINREALESEYVSMHLHLWVDLIFGYKQRGPPATEAHNLFYYLTYEGAVNLDSLDDHQRRSTIAQIENFGQTPIQLFKKPHPKRLPLSEGFQTIFTRLHPKVNFQFHPVNIAQDELLHVCVPSHYFRFSAALENDFISLNDELITVTSQRLIGLHRFSSSNSSSVMANPPFPFQLDIDTQNNKKINAPFAQDLKLASHQFACLKNGAALLSCGHWDGSIKCTWFDGLHPVQTLNKHKDLVTCLALGVDGKTFVSGSKDTTVLVWDILHQKGVPVRVDENPVHTLYGHDDEVTCVAVDVGLDVVVSGSNDGSCIVHNLRQGTYLRTIFHPQKQPISIIAISSNGYIIFYSKEDLLIYVFDVNGNLICSLDSHERLRLIYLPHSWNMMITAAFDGTLSFRQITDLKCITKMTLPQAVTSISMSKDEGYLLAALEDGHLMIVSIDDKILAVSSAPQLSQRL